MKSYSECMSLSNYIDRYNYLKIGDRIGRETFGHDRWLNQALYTSDIWRRLRYKLAVRDEYDMAVDGYELGNRWVLHHINPITKQDLLERSDRLFDPENLICVSYGTHEAIHYGDKTSLATIPKARYRNDTCPWKEITN